MALETSPQPFAVRGTASQLKLHARYAQLRARLIWVLGTAYNDQLYKRACRMDDCCRAPEIVRAEDGRVSARLHECKDRMCPRCQELRGRKLSTRMAGLVSKFRSARLITLTLRHHRGESLVAMLDRLALCFKLIRKEAAWKLHVDGGVWSVEVTVAEDGSWHAHLHIIAEGEYWEQRSISDLWARITGDSFRVHIKPVHDRKATAYYITTYVSKPTDVDSWTDDHLREFALAMHGRRLVHSFGSAHNAVPPEERAGSDFDRSRPAVPVVAVINAAKNGVPRAQRAIEILSRLGPIMARALGVDPPPSTPPIGTVTEAELQRAWMDAELIWSNWGTEHWQDWCSAERTPRPSPRAEREPEPDLWPDIRELNGPGRHY